MKIFVCLIFVLTLLLSSQNSINSKEFNDLKFEEINVMINELKGLFVDSKTAQELFGFEKSQMVSLFLITIIINSFFYDYYCIITSQSNDFCF
jgi:hypothetical protein